MGDRICSGSGKPCSSPLWWQSLRWLKAYGSSAILWCPKFCEMLWSHALAAGVWGRNYLFATLVHMGTNQNARYGSRPRHTIHTPRSIPWSIPHDTAWSIPLIHTPDPYPFLVEERLMLALMLLFILIMLLVLVLLLPLLLPLFLLLHPLPPLPPPPPLPPLAASAASVLLLLLLLLLLPLLVIFLPGAAAPAGPAPAAGADWIPPCASGSWTNATSWLAASNTASALLVLL